MIATGAVIPSGPDDWLWDHVHALAADRQNRSAHREKGRSEPRLLNRKSDPRQPPGDPIGGPLVTGAGGDLVAELRVLPKIGIEPRGEIICASGFCS
jgi:hypothetical protein